MLTTELGAIPSWQPAHFVPYFRKKSSRQNTSLMERRVEVSWCLFRWKRDLFLTKHFSLRGCAQEAQLRHFACQGWSTTLDFIRVFSKDRPPLTRGFFFKTEPQTTNVAERLLSFWTFIVLAFKGCQPLRQLVAEMLKRLKMRKVDLP